MLDEFGLADPASSVYRNKSEAFAVEYLLELLDFLLSCHELLHGSKLNDNLQIVNSQIDNLQIAIVKTMQATNERESPACTAAARQVS